MPPKNPNKGIRKHGTEDGQQTNVEAFKHKKAYTKLKIKNDSISDRIRDFYNHNHWNLKDQFNKLKAHYRELGIVGAIAWENDIQYLDYDKKPIANPKRSLQKFMNGEYKSIGTYKKPNSLETEKTYAKRIIFFTKTFPDFNRFANKDDLQWTIDHNRLLFLNVLKYHSDKQQTLSAINRDLKAIIRVYRLLLGDGIENELKYKTSALQIAITDLNNYTDDFNNVISDQELNNFIPYEQLLDICDAIEKDYNDRLNKLPSTIRTNGKKHPENLFQLHQLLLAIAINLWNFPSRSENYELVILKNKQDDYRKSNYLIITDHGCWLNYNERKKDHRPLTYEIKSSHITALNIRLCKLLRYSIKTYDRPFLFVNSKLWYKNRNEQVSHSTVSKWVRDVITEKNNGINKNIGVNVFRSAFVSYYFPRFNNRGKNILKIRMRTSTDIILRSYLKIYQNPDALAKVSVNPSNNLLRKVAKGQSKNNPIVISDSRSVVNRNRPNSERKIVPNIDLREKTIQKVHTMRKKQFKKWLLIAENKKKFHQLQRHPFTYARRYVRELNSGRKSIDSLRDTTKIIYKIKVNDLGVFYSGLLR